MGWTEQEKQEVKSACLRKESIGGIAARHERIDGGALGQGSGDGAYVPARRPGEGWE